MKIIKPVKAVDRKKAAKKMPPDHYTPMMPVQEVFIDDARTLKVALQRGGENANDALGLPCVDIRTFQTTEAYTGYTKKGINIPLDRLPELIEVLQAIDDKAIADKLYEEYTD